MSCSTKLLEKVSQGDKEMANHFQELFIMKEAESPERSRKVYQAFVDPPENAKLLKGILDPNVYEIYVHLRGSHSVSTDGDGDADTLEPFELPKGVCVNVNELRPKYSDIEDWSQDPKHRLVTRHGRVFVGRGDDRHVFTYKGSEWANPFNLKDYSLDTALTLFEAYLNKKLTIPEYRRLFLSEMRETTEIGCFCRTVGGEAGKCHRDVILKKLQAMMGGESEREKVQSPSPILRNSSSRKGELLIHDKISRRIGSITSATIDDGKRPLFAAFDLDHTLLKPLDGRIFPTHKDDAQLAFESVGEELEKLYQKGYSFVIFTNQSKLPFEDVVHKVEKFLPHGSEFWIYSGHKDIFSKPSMGMYEMFMYDLRCEFGSSFSTLNPIDFYVGDAAGRKRGPKSRIEKSDYSAVDKQFAFNCHHDMHGGGIPFWVPESLFAQGEDAGEKAPPINLLPPLPTFMEEQGMKHPPIDYDAVFKDPTVIILVGYPGSGKSSFTYELTSLLPDNINIAVVSNDELGSLAKSLSTLKKLVSSPADKRPHLIVIDNTNPSIHTRQQYMDVVKENEGEGKAKYKFVGVHIDTPKEYAMLFNWHRAWVQFREGLRTMNCEDGVVNGSSGAEPRRVPRIPEYKHVPEIAYNVYKSKYEPLALDQGYDAIYEYTPLVDYQNPCYKYTHAFMK